MEHKKIPLSEARWIVNIRPNRVQPGWYWEMRTEDYSSIKLHCFSELMSGGCPTKEYCEKDFIEFAKLNGITKYNIVFRDKP